MSLKKLWKKHDMFLVRKHLPAEAESNQEKKEHKKNEEIDIRGFREKNPENCGNCGENAEIA